MSIFEKNFFAPDLFNVAAPRKPWPADCIWADPRIFNADIDDCLEKLGGNLDSPTRALLEEEAYADSLIDQGILDEDFMFVQGAKRSSVPFNDSHFSREGFCVEEWYLSTIYRLNHLLQMKEEKNINVVASIESVIGYHFNNIHLLRQAFTRRAFAIEYGIHGYHGTAPNSHAEITRVGCSEELEFLGDSVLNMVVSASTVTTVANVNGANLEAPFVSPLSEGDFSQIRSHYVSKEHLAERARALGLNSKILYGTGETETDSSCEDMMEALIGAVALDCGWDIDIIDHVVDKLICLQVDNPYEYAKSDYNDFNSWHQRRFGKMPDYDVEFGDDGGYTATVRFRVPENNRGLPLSHEVEYTAATQSAARNIAARFAMDYIQENGLWMDWKNANVAPDSQLAINQLQELFQKKYLAEKPAYVFHDIGSNMWLCECICGGIKNEAKAVGKTEAKKQAAYKTLLELMKAAGVDTRA